MRYKIFISDFDGTLVRDDGTVSEKNVAAIENYRKQGGIFVICSGRMTGAIVPRARELGLDGILVSYQGAVITDLKTGETLKCAAFNDERAYEVIAELEARGFHTHIYTADKFYCNRDDEALRIYENICKVKAEVVEDLCGFAKRNRLKIIKTVVMVEKEVRQQVENELSARFGKDCYVTSSALCLVEVMPAGTNKGSAVKFLSEYYNVPVSQIAAIGDMKNDIPLVSAAGGKFAVGNAEAELKSIATTVPACEEDGVAYAIENYALKEE